MSILWRRISTGLAPLLVVAWSDAVVANARRAAVSPNAWASALTRSTALQQLVCRGGPGFRLEVYKDSSPNNPRIPQAVLRYTRQTTAAGADYRGLEPGKCTWNNTGSTGMPVEPGYVYFDIPREAQPWSSKETRQMDTTITAAAFFPDFVSIPRYLAHPSKYWVFFVDDKTQLAISFGAYKDSIHVPTYSTVTGSLVRETGPAAADAANLSLTRELRCRGGPEGLVFGGATSAGANLVKMALAYHVASAEFGATGRGVGPGTCAWVQRSAGTPEPGRIVFTTSANAQLSQIRSGSAVDRTPTAAERFPDANTIPAYMRDANHYWTFTVARTEPTVAKTNAAWKLTIADVVTSRPPSENPTLRSKPDIPEARPVNSPGARGATSDAVKAALAIHDVQVRPGLNAVAILFNTASSATPAVSVSAAPPIGGPGNYRFGAPVQLVVRGTRRGNVIQYTAYTQTPLAMNTRHWFLIAKSAADGMPAEQRTGEFMTKNQSVLVSFHRVHILNDSDTDSDGELSFRFYIAPASESQPCYGRPDVDDCLGRGFDGRSWGSGSTHPLANTLRMPTAPDRIRVWVKGWDNDKVTGDAWGRTLFGPGGGARFGAKGGGDRTADWNTASGEFNIGIARDKDSFSIPFKLRSVDGSVFMFEVEGEIQVTRR